MTCKSCGLPLRQCRATRCRICFREAVLTDEGWCVWCDALYTSDRDQVVITARGAA